MHSLDVIPIRDIQKINQLGCQTYLPHYPHLWHEGGVEWYLNKCFNERQLEMDLANPSLSYYAILSDGQEVGLLKLVRNKAPFGLNPATCLYLEKIYFLKEFTGLGLGQQTISWVVEQAQISSMKTVWLMAMDTSYKAITSYEKAGFQQMSSTRLDDEEFQRMKPEFRGMVILKKDLA